MSAGSDHPQFSSENRVMTLTTPLKDETLLLSKLTALEAISELFEITLELYSPNSEIDFDQIISQRVSIEVKTPGGGGRFFNGVVSKFTQGDTLGSLTSYTMQISPWFWFLTQTQTCRIFPNQDSPTMTVKDILKSVFSKYEGFVFDLKFDVQTPVAYRVQYLESDFAFASRIMEESGLGYYFTHEESADTLVVFNQGSTPVECPSHQTARYWPTTEGTGQGLDTDTIKSLRVARKFHATTYTASDFDPNDPGDHQNPGAKLTSSCNVTTQDTGSGLFEVYQYPGGFELLTDGDTLTKQWACVAEQDSCDFELKSECSGFISGHKFELVDHPRKDFNGDFLITKIKHTISQPVGIAGMDDSIDYSNETSCMRLSANQMEFVPKEKTPKPIITGIQIATVVSTSGKGLDLDEKGLILLKFPWDREQNTTSCRVRVSQNQAGSGWGSVSAPHVGQEVLVAYLGGNPDRPVVVGRVYNASNLEQLAPGKHTRTTMRNHGGVVFEMEGGPVSGVE